MKNENLEKALEDTWKNKDRFYEDTKNLSMVEILKNIESKYKTRENQNVKIGKVAVIT